MVEPEGQTDELEELPEQVFELVEWLAASAAQSRGIVAEAVRKMDDATARAGDGQQI